MIILLTRSSCTVYQVQEELHHKRKVVDTQQHVLDMPETSDKQ